MLHQAVKIGLPDKIDSRGLMVSAVGNYECDVSTCVCAASAGLDGSVYSTMFLTF
jgi:hypothetical protein